MRRFLVLLVVLGLVFVAWSATASAATKARPFQGYMIGACSFVPDATSPTGMYTYSSAAGEASHMGATMMTARHPSGFTFTGGEMTMVAANGRELHIEYIGGSAPPEPGAEFYDVDVDFTIVGGTGRFAHASGGGHLTVRLDFLGFDVFVWPATFTWHGKIRY